MYPRRADTQVRPYLSIGRLASSSKFLSVGRLAWYPQLVLCVYV
jgi:hypothetical protein